MASDRLQCIGGERSQCQCYCQPVQAQEWAGRWWSIYSVAPACRPCSMSLHARMQGSQLQHVKDVDSVRVKAYLRGRSAEENRSAPHPRRGCTARPWGVHCDEVHILRGSCFA